MRTIYSKFSIFFLILILLSSCSSEPDLIVNSPSHTEAKVINIISSITLQDQEFNLETQKTKILVKILKGNDKDKEIVITQQLISNGKEMGIPRIGDTVILTESPLGDGTSALQITDYKRNGITLTAFLIFAVFLCLTGGIKSIIFFGVIIFILLITAFILLPLFSYGISPITLTFLFSLILCTLVNLLIYNFNEKSKNIILSNFFSLFVVTIFAYIFASSGAFSPLLSGIYAQGTNAGSIIASAILLSSVGGIINISANSFNLTKDIKKRNQDADILDIVITTIRYSKSSLFLNLFFVSFIFIGLSLPVLIARYKIYSFASIINQDILSFYIIALSISGLGIIIANITTSVFSAYTLLTGKQVSGKKGYSGRSKVNN